MISRHLKIVVISALILSGCKGLEIGQFDLNRIADLGQKFAANKEMTQQQEEALGAKMTAVILGSGQLQSNANIQKYVNRVGYWVAMHSERPDLNWTFAVMNSSDLNAFAMPGGYVVITSGLIDNLHSEAELAGVLAHEIAHVVEKHHLKAIQSGNTMSLVKDVTLFAKDTYESQYGRSSNPLLDDQIAAKLLSTTQEIYAKGLTKEDEYQADQRALVLMSRAGYDPYGFVATLQMLEGIQPQDTHLAFLFATHPSPRNRLENVGAILTYLESKPLLVESLEPRYALQIRR